MVSALAYAALVAASSAVLLSGVDAHQRVTIPAPTFTADKNTNWNPLAFLENQGVKANADILGYLKSNNVKSLRDFMDNKSNYKIEAAGATFECGYTNPNGARQPIPANGMMRSTGYTHEGPCEIWLDNTMVKHGDNCHFDIGSGPTSYKIDWSACKGNCMLRWYWFGNRPIGSKRSWQIYKACIPMTGSGARDASNATEGESANEYGPNPTPLPTTATPAATMQPTKGPVGEPAADGDKSSASSKCKVRRT